MSTRRFLSRGKGWTTDTDSRCARVRASRFIVREVSSVQPRVPEVFDANGWSSPSNPRLRSSGTPGKVKTFDSKGRRIVREDKRWVLSRRPLPVQKKVEKLFDYSGYRW